MGVGVKPVEDVVDLSADVGPEAQELAVDPMQDGLEEVPLPGIFTVEQLQELQGETDGMSRQRQLLSHSYNRLLWKIAPMNASTKSVVIKKERFSLDCYSRPGGL